MYDFDFRWLFSTVAGIGFGAGVVATIIVMKLVEHVSISWR